MGFWTLHEVIYDTLQIKRDVTQSSERNTFTSQCQRASRNERAPLEVLNHGRLSHSRIVSVDKKAMAGVAQMLYSCSVMANTLLQCITMNGMKVKYSHYKSQQHKHESPDTSAPLAGTKWLSSGNCLMKIYSSFNIVTLTVVQNCGNCSTYMEYHGVCVCVCVYIYKITKSIPSVKPPSPLTIPFGLLILCIT